MLEVMRDILQSRYLRSKSCAQTNVLKCNSEVTMITLRWSNSVEYMINEKSHELATLFRDIWFEVL